MYEAKYAPEYRKGFHPIYLLAILYVIGIYAFPFLLSAVNDGLENARSESEAVIHYWPVLLPAVLGVINLAAVVILRKRLHRFYFLNCTILIKYCLIPFFVIGGLCIALALLLTFTPVVIMVFVGPAIAVTFSVLGWIALVGGSPYALAYAIKAKREGVHGKVLTTVACILQFIFGADVISVMVLSMKEGRWRKLTVAVILLLVLAAIAALIGVGAMILLALQS
ncbi:MAG: hypothetical protein IJ711_06000 [Lachnospiraceae bacterium]|nr:hypothetical protein [Lachnospiraceae bacterium]